MYLKEIELKYFRNYTEQTLTFHEKVNIITGNNAQGKTNLLESLYIMSLGKSFRTAKDSEMIAFGEEFCKARSRTQRDGEEIDIEILITKEGKSIKIDGVRARKAAELLDHVYMVIFSPEDLKIVKDEPEKRRRFLDRELCQLKPVYYKNLGRYKKILMNRNTMLRNGPADPDLMQVYDLELAEYGSKIVVERRRFVEKLNEISRGLHEKITNGRERLEVTYECGLIAKDQEPLKEEFYQKLQKTLQRDRMRATTGAGPHRDDLKLEIGGMDIRRFGSQGQQRTAALSLKLAELSLIREETGENAVLLLDDVLSELDLERQTFLLNRLEDIQIFITAAELSDTLIQSLPGSYVFQVEQGRAVRVESSKNC